MQPKPPPNYLAGYPPELAAQVRRLIEQDRLADWLMQQGIESVSLNPDTVVDTWLRLAKLKAG